MTTLLALQCQLKDLALFTLASCQWIQTLRLLDFQVYFQLHVTSDWSHDGDLFTSAVLYRFLRPRRSSNC